MLKWGKLYRTSRNIRNEVNNKKRANILVRVFLGKEWAYLAPNGAESVERGAIKINPKIFTSPKDIGGRLSTKRPEIIKKNVPGIARKKPSPAEVPTALWIGVPYKDIKLTLKVPPPIPNIEEKAPTDKGKLKPMIPLGRFSPKRKFSLPKKRLIQTNKAMVAKNRVKR